MKKYTLDIKFGENTNIDIDHEASVTDEEFEGLLKSLRPIFEKLTNDTKFCVVDQKLIGNFMHKLMIELNNIGKVIYSEQIAQFEVCMAFMA